MDEKKTLEELEINMSDMFPAGEHGIYCYYGRIGMGKTYAMTADIISALMRGEIVYANYPIDWNGYDERKSLPALFFGILGIKRAFYEFKKDNLKQIQVDEHFEMVSEIN